LTTRFDDEDPAADPFSSLLRADDPAPHLLPHPAQFTAIRRRAHRRRALRTGFGAALATATACAAFFTLGTQDTDDRNQPRLPAGPGLSQRTAPPASPSPSRAAEEQTPVPVPSRPTTAPSADARPSKPTTGKGAEPGPAWQSETANPKAPAEEGARPEAE
jgi:hypothetical protein